MVYLLAACSGGVAEPAGDAGDSTQHPDSTEDAYLPGDVTESTADGVSYTRAPGCPGAPGCPCQGPDGCDDGNPCTEGEDCVDGECAAGVMTNCSDDDPCTDAACDLASGCTHTNNDAFCEDGNSCTVADHCHDGGCLPGKAKTCDDGNGCTDDLCDPKQGCTFVHNQTLCRKGNACIEDALCAYGTCPDNAEKPCKDDNPCTYAGCDPVDGCALLPLPTPQACTGATGWGRCLQAFQGDATWHDARKACQAWGGELVSVHHKFENAFVRDLATATCGKASTWLGATDAAHEGHWRWSDGGKGGYGNWAGGEPNNSSDEDFAEMGTAGDWNDNSVQHLNPCRVCARPLETPCDAPLGCQTGAQCQVGVCLPATATRDCDDANPCTTDSCTEGTGCGHEALADPVACGSDGAVGVCQAGVCWLAETVPTPATCAAWLATHPKAPSGVFWLDPDGAEGLLPAYQTFCEMKADGGGWTLVLQVDGADPKSAYGGEIWTGKTSIGSDSPVPDDSAARLPGYWTHPVSALRVGMRAPTVDGKSAPWHWISFPVAAPSLQAAFAADKPIATELGAATWKSLLSTASLQSNCHAEGLNASSTGATKVRVGILGNNENDCGSVDSWFGLGGTITVCGAKDVPTTGNIACWGADQGNAKAVAWGAVMVR